MDCKCLLQSQVHVRGSRLLEGVRRQPGHSVRSAIGENSRSAREGGKSCRIRRVSLDERCERDAGRHIDERRNRVPIREVLENLAFPFVNIWSPYSTECEPMADVEVGPPELSLEIKWIQHVV